jgi:hypothetical protein
MGMSKVSGIAVWKTPGVSTLVGPLGVVSEIGDPSVGEVADMLDAELGVEDGLCS